MTGNVLISRERLSEQECLPLSTIDYYVSKGLLSPLNIEKGSSFTPLDALKLQIIKRGKALGFSLDEIKRLIEAAAPKT